MDTLQEVEHALSADLLRAPLLGVQRPRIADRYVVSRLLGRGASGVVVAAEDLRLRRTVALKLGFPGSDISNLAEAQALATLDHPNVVRVFDVGEVDATFDGRRFRLSLVCMQHVDGSTLRVWLHQETRSVREILEVFIAAGRGLAAAHASKLVHRDFKPDNVLVRADGVAQVIDFGFALPAKSSVWTSETLLQVAGTFLYMAPEARQGQVTRRSDQYSFGVSLVEAFVGEPRAATGARPAQVPRAVWTALSRATSAQAGDRFPDMTGLLEALESGMPSKPARSRTGRVLSGIALLVVLLAVAGMAMHPQLKPLLSTRWLAWWSHPHGPRPARAAPALNDQGTPVPPDAGSSELAVVESPLRARETDAGTAHASVVSRDAGIPDAGTPQCPEVVGTYVLTTEATWGDRRAVGIRGTYFLTLAWGRRTFRAALVKTGRDIRHELADEEVTLRSDCTIVLSAVHTRRSYQFSLSLQGTGGTGTFTAEGDSTLGRYGGTVRIEKVTSP